MYSFLFLFLLFCQPFLSLSYLDQIEVKIGEKIVNTTFNKNRHISQFKAFIPFNGVIYEIQLFLNTGLLSASYKETFEENGIEKIRETNHVEEFCYYVGSVVGHDSSSAGFSTCQGLKGFFTLFNKIIHVEPIKPEKNKLNLNYKITLETDDSTKNFVCGLKNSSLKTLSIINNSRIKRSVQKNALVGKRFIELSILSINYSNKVFEITKELVNLASLIFQQVGYYITLVGIDLIDINEIGFPERNAELFLKWFQMKRGEKSSISDNSYFLWNKVFDNSVMGLAFVGTMCTINSSLGIASVKEDNLAISAATLVHEMSHNLGVHHDTPDCKCLDNKTNCIMHASASLLVPSKVFSSCSVNQFHEAVLSGKDICLYNVPEKFPFPSETCGNGILEDGEECDCGGLPESECSSRCCNKENCKLKGDSSCAQGDCCDLNTCKTRKLGHICRRRGDYTCDLEEFCDGRSIFCPKDVFRQNGIKCIATNNLAGYCFDGVCQNRDKQCQDIWGISIRDSSFTCYKNFNVNGNEWGHCNYKKTNEIEYEACKPEDVMCGALMCDALQNISVKYSVFSYTNNLKNGKNCYLLTTKFVDSVQQPSLVYNGSPCGQNKACLDHKCVNIETLKQKVPCPQCIHGVCNSRGNCHCDLGFGGKTCNEEGQGGSIDSNPMTPKKKGNGFIAAIVIVLLIIILLVVLLIYDNKKTQYVESFLRKIKTKKIASPNNFMETGRRRTLPPPNMEKKSATIKWNPDNYGENNYERAEYVNGYNNKSFMINMEENNEFGAASQPSEFIEEMYDQTIKPNSRQIKQNSLQKINLSSIKIKSNFKKPMRPAPSKPINSSDKPIKPPKPKLQKEEHEYENVVGNKFREFINKRFSKNT